MEKDNDLIQVLFSQNEVVPVPWQVTITPVDSGWNDFGFQIKCVFRVCVSADVESIEGSMLIGFLPPHKASKAEQDKFYEWRPTLAELIKKSNKAVVTPDDIPPFFTLLPDLMNYRHLVDGLGPKLADIFLKSVNDLVVYKHGRHDWVEKALASEVFSRGFMRNSEPFFAFNNADSVLSGIEEEDFSAISKTLDLTFALDGYRNPHKINFRFSNEGLIPRRINILIGKNGLGKSLALRYFCRAALRYQDPEVSLSDSKSPLGRPMISRILAVATPGETGNTFPSERKKSQKLFYRRLNLTRNSRAKTSRSIGETLVQLARSDQRIGDSSRWDLFLGAIQKSLPTDSLLIALKTGEVEYVPLNEFIKGGEQATLDRWANVDPKVDPRLQVLNNAYPLSSGQLTFFKFALLCCLYIENGSFVLMDEPETHMHPNMISDFVELLDYLLEHTGSHAILATHSAYFVREVPKEQVHVFQQLENRGVSIEQPRLRTFGATVDSISQFVFGENAEIRLTDKIYEKVKGRSFESVDKELNDQLSLAALMDLKRRLEAI